MRKLICCLVAAAALLTACGSGDTDTDTAASTRTTAEPEATTTTVPPTTAAPAPVTTAAPAFMPNVPCGTDLQIAQDRVQAAGVFYSRSEDATGQQRNQVLDSNWTVVRQSPPPGTPIKEGDPVFYVVKDEEFTGC